MKKGWGAKRFNFSDLPELPAGYEIRNSDVKIQPEVSEFDDEIYGHEQIGYGCYRATIDYETLDQQ